MKSLNTIRRRLISLVIFRGLLDDPAVQALRRMLEARCSGTEDDFVEACAAFEYVLFSRGCDNWTDYLYEIVMENENVCVRQHDPETLNPLLKAHMEHELEFLNELSRLTLEDFIHGAEYLDPDVYHESWNISARDIAADYAVRLREVGSKGYGIFARYHMFTVENGALVPVKHPDPQQLEELPGYEKEREKVIANTRALLEGKPANNVLLYGDAGTGKSSAIKAIANEYAPRGLRLVEVKKNQLFQIPDLMDQLASNPLKFILFIDDLSFTTNDDNFAALKAILEGSVGGRAGNIAVYATSNRRHLIKETLEDRSGSDIHESDTRQELMSLAARFGLTVTFGQPDKSRFVQIVSDLAAQYGVGEDPEKLIVKAEAFAIRAGGRSPRVAKQFVELYRSGVPV